MKEKSIKEISNGELLQVYVNTVNEYDENPKNNENKFYMLDIRAEILKRMGD